MSEVIAGRHPVLEAIKAGVEVEKIFIAQGTGGASVDGIYRLAKMRGIPVVRSSKERFRELAGDLPAQGVAAVVGSKKYVELEDLLEIAKERAEAPFLLVLDQLEDPHNVGALLRTAEGAGVHGAVIPKHHTAPIGDTVSKTSAGASSHVAVARVSNVVQALETLKKAGVWVVGLDTEGGKLYYETDFRPGIAVVVGNEGAGIRRLVKENCDELVRIPMHGKIESLNASVAGGLVLFEVARQRTTAATKTT